MLRAQHHIVDTITYFRFENTLKHHLFLFSTENYVLQFFGQPNFTRGTSSAILLTPQGTGCAAARSTRSQKTTDACLCSSTCASSPRITIPWPSSKYKVSTCIWTNHVSMHVLREPSIPYQNFCTFAEPVNKNTHAAQTVTLFGVSCSMLERVVRLNYWQFVFV